jgi:methyl-accepting chemotaxis protein
MSDKYAIRERTIANLKFRITLFFFFFFIAIFAVFIITSVMEVNSVIHFIGERLAIPTVEEAAVMINGDAFEALSKSLDKNDPYYETTRLKLLDLKERNGCRFLYTMSPVKELSGNMYRYIIDGSTSPDDEENFSPLGTEEDISLWEPVFVESLQTKRIVLGSIDQNDVWGQTVSAYGPILNSQGNVVGVIGCDLDATMITAWVRSRVYWQVGIVAVFIAIGLIVYIGLVRRISRIYEAE